MKAFKTYLLFGLFCMISLGASAEEIPNDEIWYTSSNRDIVTPMENNFGANIVSNTYTNGKGIIKFDGNVTSIGEWAFGGCKGLTSVTIPNSVTSIGKWAFLGCKGLTSVTIPNSVTSIGENAFSDCYFQSGKFVNSSSLDAVSNNYWGATICDIRTDDGLCIKDNIAFKYVGNGTSVTIPNSVTSIGSEAFRECSSLASVAIPNSVISIGNYAFANCKGLISVTIPNSVTEIGNDAFWHCYFQSDKFVNNSSLDAVSNNYWGATICDIRTDDGLCIKDNIAFKYVGNGTSVTIPNSVTSIGGNAFESCTGLTSVTIPNSVTSIGSEAFWRCSSLTSVTIPNSVTSIGSEAFKECSSLTSVNISDLDKWAEIKFGNTYANPLSCAHNLYLNDQLVKEAKLTNLIKISGYAFYQCTSLTSIEIPNSVTSIGGEAFSGCSGLTSVHVEWKDADKIPTLSSSVFPYSTCDLYVPRGIAKQYKSKDYWSTFKNIIEFGPNIVITNIDETDGSIFAEEGDNVALNDNIKSISIVEDINNINITYTRNFVNAGKWQGWYVPFDVSVTDMAQAGFEVAKIYGILLDNSGNTVLAFLKISSGTVKANTPYVVKPKESGNVTLTTKTTLHQTSTTNFTIDSAEDTYTVGGLYEQTPTPGNWYAINKDGRFQKMGEGVGLRPFRVWMTIDSREDNPYATKSGMNMMVISKGQIYTINGKNYLAE